jgi:hypothetical protein
MRSADSDARLGPGQILAPAPKFDPRDGLAALLVPSLVVPSQWPRRGPRASGPAALAVAVLLDALVVAGFIPRQQSRRPAGSPADRATARAYLAGEIEDAVPLRLATACALAGVDQAALAQVVRQRSAEVEASRERESRGATVLLHPSETSAERTERSGGRSEVRTRSETKRKTKSENEVERARNDGERARRSVSLAAAPPLTMGPSTARP